MSLRIEWDASKAASNLRKHGVRFEEAATVLADPLSVTIVDPDHSRDERFLVLGCSAVGRFLVMAIAAAGDSVRIISARPMTPRERRRYEQEIRC